MILKTVPPDVDFFRKKLAKDAVRVIAMIRI
jgi:hypothetical protein